MNYPANQRPNPWPSSWTPNTPYARTRWGGDTGFAPTVYTTATDLFGEDRHLRWKAPLAGAEDFSRILEEVPGCFIGLSACPADLDPKTAPFNHSAYARFDDSVVADGALLLAELARQRLA